MERAKLIARHIRIKEIKICILVKIRKAACQKLISKPIDINISLSDQRFQILPCRSAQGKDFFCTDRKMLMYSSGERIGIPAAGKPLRILLRTAAQHRHFLKFSFR